MPQMLNQRVDESTIFFESMAGLKEMLGLVGADYGKPPIPVAFVSSSFAKREIGQQLGGNIVYPFIGITLQRMNQDFESYNNNLRRNGISVTNNDKVLTYKLTPVLATFRVRYVTQDSAEMLKFSSRWIRRQKDVQYALANESLKINIKVRLNNDLAVPEQNIEDFGNEFVLETECDMKTYLGEIETNTRIKEIVLNTNLWQQSAGQLVSSSTRTFNPKPKN